MRSPVIIAVVMVIVMGGAYFALTRQVAPRAVAQGGSAATPNTTPAPGGQNNTETTPVTSYNMLEVSAHNSPSDCWTAISGNVYDVTAFVASGDNPGEAEMLDGCGKDVTVMLNTIPQEGKSYMQEARDLLPQFFIGTLQ